MTENELKFKKVLVFTRNWFQGSEMQEKEKSRGQSNIFDN